MNSSVPGVGTGGGPIDPNGRPSAPSVNPRTGTPRPRARRSAVTPDSEWLPVTPKLDDLRYWTVCYRARLDEHDERVVREFVFYLEEMMLAESRKEVDQLHEWYLDKAADALA